MSKIKVLTKLKKIVTNEKMSFCRQENLCKDLVINVKPSVCNLQSKKWICRYVCDYWFVYTEKKCSAKTRNKCFH